MHMCCLIRSVIFWRTGHCLVHNIQSCIIGHCFIMTSAKTQKPDCKDSTLLHLWVNCVLTAVMSSCIQLRIVLITPHICSSLRKAHDVTVPSIFFWHWTSEPEMWRVSKINWQQQRPYQVFSYIGCCCRKYYRLSISAAVYWKGCL